MKALILSDIHANVVALESVCQKESDADVIYCAGDLVEYGPFPREVLAFIRHHKIPTVQGNHDAAVAATWQELHTAGRGDIPKAYHAIPAHERAWRHHNAALLNADEIAFLESLPQALQFSIDAIPYAMTHLYTGYDTLHSAPAFNSFIHQRYHLSPPDSPLRLIFGHTHLPAIHHLSPHHLWLNPGSISYRHREDPYQGSHYITIIDGHIHMHHLPYPLARLQQELIRTQLQPSELQAAHYFFSPRTPVP